MVSMPKNKHYGKLVKTQNSLLTKNLNRRRINKFLLDDSEDELLILSLKSEFKVHAFHILV